MSNEAQNIFELGSSVVVDPVTRRVVEIDGVPVEIHTPAMQAFADRALAEAGIDTID